MHIFFQEVILDHKVFSNETTLPRRATSRSAGYDIYSKETCTLEPGQHHTFWTDVKILIPSDMYLQIITRSGNGVKRGLQLRNQCGIIDSDYFGNPNNDGNIGICLVNTGDEPAYILYGDAIAQGILQKYYITKDDCPESEDRKGGFGSTS